MADQQDTGGGSHRRPETDDGQAMNGVEYPTPKFHSITVSGDDGGNMLTVVDLVTEGPQSLGDPPRNTNDVCSHCGGWWVQHVLDGVAVSARAFHRFDGDSFGYFSDELTAGAR